MVSERKGFEQHGKCEVMPAAQRKEKEEKKGKIQVRQEAIYAA
jgi:hypothetical protein